MSSKFSFLFLLISSLVTPVFAQSISDSEAIKIAIQEKKSGASDSEIANRLLQNGATVAQIQRIRSEYAKMATQRGLDNTGDIPVQYMEEDSTITVSYYDYLQNHQRAPWWSAARKAVFSAIRSLFVDQEEEVSTVDPFHLTKRQADIVEVLKKKVVCDVDQKTQVITIDVVDQDPIVAATLADSVQTRLQKFITDYRTRKARIDLDYNRKLLVEAEERYDKARHDYSNYSDANRKSLFEDKHSERQKLETKLQVASRSYSQVAAQLQLAEAKVQEETPAFTMLQPPSVPVLKTGPNHILFCFVWLFLAVTITILYVFHKEGDLLPLLGLDNDPDVPSAPSSLFLKDSEYILVPKSSLKKEKD